MAKDQELKKMMEPAYSAYQALNVQPDNVLVHIFSNGGVHSFRTFVSLIPSKSIAPRVLVMDSAPGTMTMATTIAAFTADIKNPFILFLASIFLTILYLWMKFKDWMMGKEPILDELKRWLVDGNAIGEKTNRVFLYSDVDELVQQESVESHIRDLEEKGYPVKSRNFGKTRHVGHMRANPEEYWSEILEAWSG